MPRDSVVLTFKDGSGTYVGARARLVGDGVTKFRRTPGLGVWGALCVNQGAVEQFGADLR